ncbi:MAG: hypothetical protein LBB94_02275, partial [Clostridiales bacterium]|nr:hypothetical protein [Clostridiales bacterium]
MHEQIIRKLTRHFGERGDLLSVDVLRFALARPVHEEIAAKQTARYSTAADLTEFYAMIESAGTVILYGAGRYGRRLYSELKERGVGIAGVMDTYKTTDAYGGPILSAEQYLREFSETPIVIASNWFTDELEEYLESLGITNIISPPVNSLIRRLPYNDAERLYRDSGPAYFQPFFQRRPGEVFIYCGVFDGETAAQFYNWARGGGDGLRLESIRVLT